MTRRTFAILIVMASFQGVAVPWALGQANAPMEVHGASPSAKSARTSNADEPDLRQFAKQMLSRPAAGTPVPAEDELLPATGQTGVQASAEPQALAAPTAARQTVAPPVVAPDPNESLPLGRHAAGQPTGSSGDASSHGLGWGATQTLIALAVVVGLILLGRQLLIRFTGRPGATKRSRVVEVLSRVSVGPRQHVVLIRLGGRILVVSDSAGQMRLLANLDDVEEVASILKSVTASKPTSISEGFQQLMGKFDQDFDKAEATRLRDEGQDIHEHQTDRARDQLSGLLARVRSMAGKGDA